MLDKNCNILSVDDFSTMRRIVKNILRQLGYTNVDEAPNGEEAFNAMKSKKYDLVISDWNMPVKTGIELLKDVRADADLSGDPVPDGHGGGRKAPGRGGGRSGCQ